MTSLTLFTCTHLLRNTCVSCGMEETQGLDPPGSPAPVIKKVLVCFGERKREVTFTSATEKDGDVKAVMEAVSEVFADVLDSSDNPTRDLILQIKNEAWNGEFLDVKGEIPDGTVLRAVFMKQGECSAGTRTDVSLSHCMIIINVNINPGV